MKQVSQFSRSRVEPCGIRGWRELYEGCCPVATPFASGEWEARNLSGNALEGVAAAHVLRVDHRERGVEGEVVPALFARQLDHVQPHVLSQLLHDRPILFTHTHMHKLCQQCQPGRHEVVPALVTGQLDHVQPHVLGQLLHNRPVLLTEREFFLDNLLVRIHFIIVMIRWTGLAPWEFEFPFPGSLASTLLFAHTSMHTPCQQCYNYFAEM